MPVGDINTKPNEIAAGIVAYPRTMRQARVDLLTSTEMKLKDAAAEIESMGCDVKLSQAQMHISDALSALGSYVDEQLSKAL